MKRCAALRLIITAAFELAAHGCGGYSNGSYQRAEDASLDASQVPDAAATIPSNPPASDPESSDGAISAHSDEPPSMEPAQDEMQPPSPTKDASEPMLSSDAGTALDTDAGADAGGSAPADLRLLRSPRFEGYIADSAGEPLYMFVGDVPGSKETTCLGTCASAWPPFDAIVEHVSSELDFALVARFHREDGAWQTTYKGHPLYRRASEAVELEVTGDNLDGRWFVARDYLAFMGSARTFAPAGGTGTNGPFLTDGFGRALYVCLDDTPATALTDPDSSCDSTCLARRPAFSPSDAAAVPILPSILDPAELQAFVRDDGTRQFMYRGWPLYYFSGDVAVGATEGHNDGAWRAFDPVQFQQ